MNDRNDIYTRSELLRYYSTECLGHIGYILTLVLVFGGSFEIAKYISNSSVKALILSTSISTVMVIGAYLVLRTLWWGCLVNAVFQVKQELGDDLKSLHQRCAEYVCGRGTYKGRERKYYEKIASIVDHSQLHWVGILWLIFVISLFLLNRHLNDALVHLLKNSIN